MDPLGIIGLVQLIYGLMDSIIVKAKQVYYLKPKCEEFASKIDEIQHTLRNAKLESDKDPNEFAVQRLDKLKETLTRADVLLSDFAKPMKYIVFLIGKADRKLDALEKDIMDSVNLLNLHLHGGSSSSQRPGRNPRPPDVPVDPPPTTATSHMHHSRLHGNPFGFHNPFHVNHVPTADPPHHTHSHDNHHFRMNIFSVLCPYCNPSAEYRRRG